MASTVDFSIVQLAQGAFAILIAGYAVKLLRDFYYARTLVAGLPTPPHSFLFGSTPIMAKIFSQFPPRTHPHTVIPSLRKMFNLPPIFYIDTWPFGESICVVLDPDVASQVTVQPCLLKHKALEQIVLPLTGRDSLLTIEGKHHREWRNVFNPGFSNNHLMTLVDGVVEDSLVFLDILSKHANTGSTFLMEEAATRFTVDVIGRVVLDAPMNAQKSENEFVTAFRQTMAWFIKQPEYNPFSHINPLRPIIHELNRRKMNRYLGKIIDDRFAAKSRNKASLNLTSNKRQPQPVIDLALDVYTRELGTNSNQDKVDPAFKAAAMNHIKLFMFAGHDTTSSTICYAIYELFRHPESLTKLLEECNTVFGPDPTQTATQIKTDPYLINKLPFTTAIIKETLRLWAPASTLRKGYPGFYLNHDGKQYPTDGFVVWPVISALQRDPNLWPSANTFIPERWMVDKDDPLYPPKGAWRPFELGPRSCIGQDLALIESRIILVLMLRLFNVRPVYDELDAKSAGRDLKRTPDGERAYQVMYATAKPADGMPVVVERR